jgi:RNA polymerase sigma factor (sigma-70 family)
MSAASHRTEARGPSSPQRPVGADAAKRMDELYRRHYVSLVRRARAGGADWALAEDAVQAAFATVHHRLDMQHDIENASAYLHTVVRNEVVRSLSHIRELPTPDEWLDAWVGSEPSTEETYLPKVSPAYEAARSLPPRQRTVLALTVDGYEAAEIAQLLGLQDATVRAHLHAARKKAQANLATEESRTTEAA